MAKHNPGDILTCDWNPVVGCARYSAGHRLVMIEPMLGPVDLTAFPEVSWVVLGSETGADGPRPMALDWARAVRDWAQARGIPFFLKQIGPDHRRPERHLDGRTWDEFPLGFRK